MADYVRREPRTPLSCPAMVTREGGVSVLGDLIDLSPHGAAVSLPMRLAKGTPVKLLLEVDNLPALRGIVVSSLPSGTAGGEARFRVGVEFGRPDPAVEARFGRGTGANRIGMPEDAAQLASTPGGREQLYQQALLSVAISELGIAQECVRHIVAADPRSLHYRALAARILAEQALAAGHIADARRELERARAILGLPQLDDLEQRIRAAEPTPAKPGLLSRLFRRS